MWRVLRGARAADGDHQGMFCRESHFEPAGKSDLLDGIFRLTKTALCKKNHNV
jgi:hypothetical protein